MTAPQPAVIDGGPLSQPVPDPPSRCRGWLLRWLILPVVIIPVSLLLAFGFTRDPRALPSALIGKPAPSFSLVTLDGGTLDSASLRGRPVVVNFWASWCPECKVEHPVLIDGQRRYRDRVAFIGVLYQDRVEDARRYLEEMGDSGYPNLIDAAGALALDFGVTGPPETYFIDAAGLVRYKQWGALTNDVLETQLGSLLASGQIPPYRAPSADAKPATRPL